MSVLPFVVLAVISSQIRQTGSTQTIGKSTLYFRFSPNHLTVFILSSCCLLKFFVLLYLRLKLQYPLLSQVILFVSSVMRDSLTVRPCSNIFGRFMKSVTSVKRTGCRISMRITTSCGVTLIRIISFVRSLNARRKSLLSSGLNLTSRLTVWRGTVI